MRAHERLHRRQGRSSFPDPKAIADALADAFPNPFAEANPQRTVVSVVYVTASPTFDGPIGGYRTLGPNGEEIGGDDQTTTTRSAQKTTVQPQTTFTKSQDPTTKDTKILVETSAPSTRAKQTTLQTTSLPSEISSPTLALTSSAAIVVASGSATRSATFTRTTAIRAAEATSSSAPVKSEGMSTGGKAGLAIGILLLVGGLLAIILFLIKKKKDKAKQERLDDEKSAAAFAAVGRPASSKTDRTAPRLSLRPVTQFLPNLGEKRASRGNALNAFGVAPQPQHQRQQTPPEMNRNNPFGDHAGTIDSANANGPSQVQVNGSSGEIIVAAAPTGATGGLARGASKRGEKPKDFTTKGPFMGPPSPSGTEFSQSSDTNGTPTATGTAIAAAGGPANSAVHRVQLDFKPSMEDELELRAGQLIRLLHEYDDGWALCIRLDRSQQGVVPRTCLSTRPVKPRPQQPPQGQRGPPPGQRGPQGQMRPMSPAMNGPPRGGPPVMGQGSRPSSPSGRNSPGPQYNGQRPMTPQGQPRPMTPQGQQRPMTPQGQGRPRSPSIAQQPGRKGTPPGPSSMNRQPQLSSSPPNGAPVGRKPVPGQAL